MRYGISFTSPAARTRSSSRLTSRISVPGIELHDRIHVLVPPAAETDEDAALRAELPAQRSRVVKRMCGLQCREDPLQAAAHLEGGDRLLVGDGHVRRPLQVAQQRVLRPDAGVVEA